jgi:hypothetical protein
VSFLLSFLHSSSGLLSWPSPICLWFDFSAVKFFFISL